MIDGKARLVSDLMCDGLGACLGHCPQGAITIEKREAEPYNETKVMEIMVEKGANTVVAHLSHLKEHNEMEYLGEGVRYLKEHEDELDFEVREVLSRVHNSHVEEEQLACGCAGSEARSFAPQSAAAQPASAQPVAMAPISMAVATGPGAKQPSELRQWPVQMHLINPAASYFQQTDMVLAADCVAFSLGDFHSNWLKGKTLAIACPKLDDFPAHLKKLADIPGHFQVKSLPAVHMEVPCCAGLVHMVKQAMQLAGTDVPLKEVTISIRGEVKP